MVPFNFHIVFSIFNAIKCSTPTVYRVSTWTALLIKYFVHFFSPAVVEFPFHILTRLQFPDPRSNSWKRRGCCSIVFFISYCNYVEKAHKKKFIEKEDGKEMGWWFFFCLFFHTDMPGKGLYKVCRGYWWWPSLPRSAVLLLSFQIHDLHNPSSSITKPWPSTRPHDLFFLDTSIEFLAVSNRNFCHLAIHFNRNRNLTA